MISRKYYNCSIEWLSLSLCITRTTGIRGRRIMLMGKKVMVMHPKSSSYYCEFLSLMMSILLVASMFFQTWLYRSTNMAIKKLKSSILEMKEVMMTYIYPS